MVDPITVGVVVGGAKMVYRAYEAGKEHGSKKQSQSQSQSQSQKCVCINNCNCGKH